MENSKDYTKELYELAGVSFPLRTTINNQGQLVAASYDSEWKEGTTEPVTDKKGRVTEYKENYKKRKLTAAQIKKVDGYIADNLVK